MNTLQTPLQESQVLLKASKVRHIAIVMDGNRRWAKERRQPGLMGHKAGVSSLKNIVKHAGAIGLEALTVYAFSTENWRRGEEEVGGLMGLFAEALGKELEELHQQNVCLRFIGDLSAFEAKLREKIHGAMAKTQHNTGLKLQVAMNYGSRAEIIRGVQKLAKQVQSGELSPDDIDDTLLSQALDTRGLPDPDLFIRTGGEYRLSNYLLWQCAYTEFWITDTLWPDFTPEVFNQALETFAHRERRFGK